MHNNKNTAKRFFSLCFGNMAEWYDFALYLYFADQLALCFFSDLSPYHAKLMTYFTFFLGALARPLGGFCVGWLSDRYNPHKVMHLCIVTMGVATGMVALLPGVQSMGVASPLLLMLLRIIQGLSAGGQFPGMIAMAVNERPQDKSFAVSMMFSVSSAGFLIAAASSLASCHFFPEIGNAWVWRTPFLLSTLLLVTYLYLHPAPDATPSITHQAKQTQPHGGLLSALKQQYVALIAVVLLTTMGGSIYFVVLGYLVDYQVHQWHLSSAIARSINMAGLASACLLYPLMGRLCDRFSAHKIFYGAAVAFIIATVPVLMGTQHGTPITIAVGMVFMVTLMAAMQSAMSPLFAAAFAPEWRTTCCAIAYNIGGAASGAAPMVALMTVTLLPNTGIALFLAALTCLGLIGFTMIQYQKKPATS